MTNHELPEPIAAPDFMQAFDGNQPEISELEKLDVAEAFSAYCEELLGRNIENLWVVTEPTEISRTSVNLVLPDTNGYWDIKVMKESHSAFTPYDIERAVPDASIYLDFYDSDKHTRSGHRYALRNSTVTREDVEDIYLEDAQTAVAGEVPKEGQALKKWLLEHTLEFDDAQTDEKQLGLNEQPISLAELEGLKEFLKHAQALRPSGDG